MLGHQHPEYAPFRKGIAHGDKTDRKGTKQYWFQYKVNDERVHGEEFEADSEEEAGEQALKLSGIEKPKDAEWAFIHECSKNRGYELLLPNNSVIQLFHILRDD